MKIIPAIDLKSGQCVRLLKGDFTQVTQYEKDPIQVANDYAKEGATQLHIVDLDGAKEANMSQTETIIRIANKTNFSVQVGGGIRSAEQIKSLLDNGIQRIVIGSLAVINPEKVAGWIEMFGVDRIVIALDVRKKDDDYYCATEGWKKNTNVTLWECLGSYKKLKYLLCTDINRDGTLTGPNILLYQKIQERYPNLCIQASGGVSKIDDIQKLSALNLNGVIVGKALYEKKCSLKDLLSV